MNPIKSEDLTDEKVPKKLEPKPQASQPETPDIESLTIYDSLTPQLDQYTGQDFTNKVATFMVGRTPQVFHAHVSLMNCAPKDFRELLKPPYGSLSKSIRLKKDDPQAFGLVLSWLYGHPIPYFGLRTSMDGDIASDARIPTNPSLRISYLPSVFETKDPTVFQEGRLPNGKSEATRYNHICIMEDYQQLSPEELRFVEAIPGQGKEESYLRWIYRKQYKSYKHPRVYRVRKGDGPVIHDRDKVLEYLRNERIVNKDRSCWNLRGELLQLTLIRLLAMAQKYGWEDLFNDTIDAYREGERFMQRRVPLARHVELICELFPESCPIRTFMSDYAFYRINITGGKRGGVAISATKNKEFLQSVVARVDGDVEVPGYDKEARAWNNSTAPLAEKAPSYHLHEGEAWTFDKWSTLTTRSSCLPVYVAKRQDLLKLRGLGRV